MHEKSPVGDHRANGWAESGVRTTEAQVRAVKLALGDRYKNVLDHTHPIVTWIVEYSGWLITRFGLGRHGKTPYRMLRGSDALSPLCEFGECVLYKPAGATRARGKLQAMLKEGMFLGRTHSSGENIIGTPDGIAKARDVHRRIASERYDVEMLKTISGTPWKTTTARDVEAEEIPEFRVLPAGSRRPEEHADNVGDMMPRRVKLTREVMERFSYTVLRDALAALICDWANIIVHIMKSADREWRISCDKTRGCAGGSKQPARARMLGPREREQCVRERYRRGA